MSSITKPTTASTTRTASLSKATAAIAPHDTIALLPVGGVDAAATAATSSGQHSLSNSDDAILNSALAELQLQEEQQQQQQKQHLSSSQPHLKPVNRHTDGQWAKADANSIDSSTSRTTTTADYRRPSALDTRNPSIVSTSRYFQNRINPIISPNSGSSGGGTGGGGGGLMMTNSFAPPAASFEHDLIPLLPIFDSTQTSTPHEGASTNATTSSSAAASAAALQQHQHQQQQFAAQQQQQQSQLLHQQQLHYVQHLHTQIQHYGLTVALHAELQQFIRHIQKQVEQCQLALFDEQQQHLAHLQRYGSGGGGTGVSSSSANANASSGGGDMTSSTQRSSVQSSGPPSPQRHTQRLHALQLQLRQYESLLHQTVSILPQQQPVMPMHYGTGLSNHYPQPHSPQQMMHQPHSPYLQNQTPPPPPPHQQQQQHYSPYGAQHPQHMGMMQQQQQQPSTNDYPPNLKHQHSGLAPGESLDQLSPLSSVVAQLSPQPPRGFIAHPRTQSNMSSSSYNSNNSNSSALSLGGQPMSRQQQVRDFFVKVRAARHSEVERLLSTGLVDASSVDERGNTALHVACQCGNKKMCKIALRWGTNINARNLQGCTAIFYAFVYHYDTLGAYLITKGASDEVKNVFGYQCYAGKLRPTDPQEALQLVLDNQGEFLPDGVTIDMIKATLLEQQ